jgi:hypothetical protein
MLPLQFFSQNIHFAINLFAALVFFAVFWLYYDAWTNKHDTKVLVKWLGFLLVAISYLAQSTVIEQSVLGNSSLNNVSKNISAIFCVIGFLGIILGQLLDPLQKEPEVSGLAVDEFTAKEPAAPSQPSPSQLPAVGAAGLVNPLHWFPPLGALTIAILYWRRATTGLERHLKPVAVAFGLLFIAELLSLASLWNGTSNPTISKLVAAFGPLWIAQLIFLFAGSLVLGWWVWEYLTRRFMSQLFMIFTSSTLAIFLLTTVSFTFLLVSNVQKTSLDNLQTAAGVLNYAISGKKSETLADTQSIAENPDVASAVIAKDHNSLNSLTSSYLHDKQQSSLTITSNFGQVLLRAEDPDRWGDSISSDASIRLALIGQSTSSVSIQDGVLAPLIYIKSAVPIRSSSNSQIVGAAEGGLVLDSAFVDGIKQATGLDSSIYAGNVVSATTFLAPDGITRWVGVKETSRAVQTEVLKKGQTFKGALSIQNRQYLAVFAPLKDLDNNIIGMLFIGQPQTVILQTAGRSVELTFVVTACLLILAVIPAYLISKYLTRQLHY